MTVDQIWTWFPWLLDEDKREAVFGLVDLPFKVIGVVFALLGLYTWHKRQQLLKSLAPGDALRAATDAPIGPQAAAAPHPPGASKLKIAALVCLLVSAAFLGGGAVAWISRSHSDEPADLPGATAATGSQSCFGPDGTLAPRRDCNLSGVLEGRSARW